MNQHRFTDQEQEQEWTVGYDATQATYFAGRACPRARRSAPARRRRRAPRN
jgi:hypothetical protein